MIAFELSMPNRGSWDNKWSGDDRRFIRVRRQNEVPKEYWNKDYYYKWDDGWTARVSVTKVSGVDAKRLKNKSSGFCGYDWMIDSIIKHGYIATKRELEEGLTNG